MLPALDPRLVTRLLYALLLVSLLVLIASKLAYRQKRNTETREGMTAIGHATADSTGTGSDDIRWSGVPMRNGSFQASGLDGRFYGPSHEEAGGVFERGGIVGAFSLNRQ